ncbi:hypothetical protein SSX86_033052 [Deinandra increscens subsp. villosa]|uniref:Uncharacterized protein n=1 Tax=Deinandra increscens subsp. villosa TaxID=3103831 RepID=A0AAP0GGF2_9ASTR
MSSTADLNVLNQVQIIMVRVTVKDDGVVAGIALAEMIFIEVDSTLKAEWFKKNGDNILCRGLVAVVWHENIEKRYMYL